jgi:hypothetical protein
MFGRLLWRHFMALTVRSGELLEFDEVDCDLNGLISHRKNRERDDMQAIQNSSGVFGDLPGTIITQPPRQLWVCSHYLVVNGHAALCEPNTPAPRGNRNGMSVKTITVGRHSTVSWFVPAVACCGYSACRLLERPGNADRIFPQWSTRCMIQSGISNRMVLICYMSDWFSIGKKSFALKIQIDIIIVSSRDC